MLYFVPNVTALTPQVIADSGLGHAIDGTRPMATRECSKGPSGLRGLVVAPTGYDRIGFYPDSQRWQRMQGHVACGTADDLPHELLARPRQLPGHLCTLGDGNEWLVPFARRWLGSNNGQLRPVSALPSAAVYSENGQWTVGTVVAKYSRLNDLAGEFWDRYFASDEPDDKQVPTIWQNEREACVTALATNYYLGPWECSLLGLFTPDAVAQILGALIDRPTLNEWVSKQKKKT